MKFVQEHCSICQKELAMPVVQEDETHPGLIWVQCPQCQEIKPMEAKSASECQIQTDILPSSMASAAVSAGGEPRRVVRHYRRGERFAAGEWIFHPEWNDTGQVIEKCRSKGGREVIVVSFQKLGIKRLVSNFAS